MDNHFESKEYILMVPCDDCSFLIATFGHEGMVFTLVLSVKVKLGEHAWEFYTFCSLSQS